MPKSSLDKAGEVVRCCAAEPDWKWCRYIVDDPEGWLIFVWVLTAATSVVSIFIIILYIRAMRNIKEKYDVQLQNRLGEESRD